MEELIYHDTDGNEYVLDEKGNRRPPMQTRKHYQESGFTLYDDSQGHCCFCGRLDCNRSCFR